MKIYANLLLALTAALWLDACTSQQIQQSAADAALFASDAGAIATAFEASAPVAASAPAGKQ